MHTVYCAEKDFDSSPINVRDNEELHHMKNVLRLSVGEKILLVNSKNQTGIGMIERITKDCVVINILQFKKTILQKPYVILACAIPKKSKFETIIEKATELGADEIIPLVTERTEIKLSQERSEKKIARYKTIAINAVKQCKRPSIPLINNPMDFSSALKNLIQRGVVLMPSLEGKRAALKDTLNQIFPDVISILIGPEGDFTSQEYKQAYEAGALPVSLGSTILRVETAAITVLATVKYFYYK